MLVEVQGAATLDPRLSGTRYRLMLPPQVIIYIFNRRLGDTSDSLVNSAEAGVVPV